MQSFESVLLYGNEKAMIAKIFLGDELRNSRLVLLRVTPKYENGWSYAVAKWVL